MNNNLFFGKQGGVLVPNQLVFAENIDSIMYVECYFPLKGSTFLLLEDTLYLTENSKLFFSGEKSFINSKNGNLLFNTKDSYTGYRIHNVILKNNSSKRELLEKYRKCSIVWGD